MPLVIPFWILEHRERSANPELLCTIIHDWLSVEGVEDDVVKYLVEQISSHRTWLLLDGLDDIDYPRAEWVLNTVANWECKLIITSSRYAYAYAMFPFSTRAYRMAPFSREQAQELIYRWFKRESAQEPPDGPLILSPFPTRFPRNPMLLSLFLWLQEHGETDLSMTVSELMQRALRAFLGAYANREQVDAQIATLGEAMRDYYCAHDGQGTIERRDLYRAIEDSPFLAQALGLSEQHHDGATKNSQATELIDLFCDRGVLSAVNRGKEYRATHQFFSAFLASKGLGRCVRERRRVTGKDPDDPFTRRETIGPWALIDAKAWHPRWRDVIIFLASALEEPSRLFALLSKPPDDLLEHRSALLGLCLADVCVREQTDLSEVLTDGIRNVFASWERIARMVHYVLRGPGWAIENSLQELACHHPQLVAPLVIEYLLSDRCEGPALSLAYFLSVGVNGTLLIRGDVLDRVFQRFRTDALCDPGSLAAVIEYCVLNGLEKEVDARLDNLLRDSDDVVRSCSLAAGVIAGRQNVMSRAISDKERQEFLKEAEGYARQEEDQSWRFRAVMQFSTGVLGQLESPRDIVDSICLPPQDHEKYAEWISPDNLGSHMAALLRSSDLIQIGSLLPAISFWTERGLRVFRDESSGMFYTTTVERLSIPEPDTTNMPAGSLGGELPSDTARNGGVGADGKPPPSALTPPPISPPEPAADVNGESPTYRGGYLGLLIGIGRGIISRKGYESVVLRIHKDTVRWHALMAFEEAKGKEVPLDELKQIWEHHGKAGGDAKNIADGVYRLNLRLKDLRLRIQDHCLVDMETKLQAESPSQGEES